MNVLNELLKDGTDAIPIQAKQLAHLINIVKELGWDSLMDPRHIKPNLRKAQLYIRKHHNEFQQIFNISDKDVNRNNIVDIINPYLIEMWHIQIIGTFDDASLQLLTAKSHS